MTTAELLRAAWTLIDDESKWCKGSAAVRADGMRVPYYSSNAARFDICGAVWRAADDADLGLHAASVALSTLRRYAPCAVMLVNDRHGYDAVTKLFARAIRAEGVAA